MATWYICSEMYNFVFPIHLSLCHMERDGGRSKGEAPVSEFEKAAEERAGARPSVATCEPRTPDHVKKAHQARQASRDDRYQQMTCLRAQGLTPARGGKADMDV